MIKNFVFEYWMLIPFGIVFMVYAAAEFLPVDDASGIQRFFYRFMAFFITLLVGLVFCSIRMYL